MTKLATLRLEELLEEFDDRLGSQSEPEILTLTERLGFVSQRERFSKRLAIADTRNYKVIGLNDIAFNPYLLWAGAVAQNVHWEKAIISPLYPTFHVRNGYSARFVNYLLCSEFLRSRYGAISFGSVPRKRRTTVKDFLNLRLPEQPSLVEQQRIVKLLDEADELRKLRDQADRRIALLIPALFHEMFGDRGHRSQTMTIEDAVERFVDYRGKTPTKSSSGVPLVTAKIVKGGRILPATEFIGEDIYDNWMRRGLPKPGDVLFTMEAPLGEVAIVRDARIALAQRILLMRPRTDLLDSRYFMTALKLPFVWKQIEERSTGSTVRGIRQAELRKVQIPVPRLPLQEEFSKRVTEIRELEAKQAASREPLDALFQSMLQSAFHGKL